MNLLINGGFEFDQERENALVTLTNGGKTHLCDGVVADFSSVNGAVIKAQRVTDGPLGARHSLKFTVTTAAAIDITDRLVILLPFGAEQIIDLCYGSASPIATSFGVYTKSSITNNFGVTFRNNNGSQSNTAQQTTSSTGAWESKTVNNLAGSTGTWINTNSDLAGYICIAPIVGSNYQTTVGNTWNNGVQYGTTSQTNTHISTVNSTFQIALPNWVIGSSVQVFQTNPDEITRVQRRFQKSYDQGTAIGTSTYAGAECVYQQDQGDFGYSHSKSFRVNMASTPTVTFYSEVDGSTGNVGDISAVVDRAVTPIAGSQNGFNMAVFNIPAGNFTMYHWSANARLL